MAVDLGKLQVERLIVHEVPDRPVRGAQQQPTLSEIESPLTPDLKNYFREKITETLDQAAASLAPRLAPDSRPSGHSLGRGDLAASQGGVQESPSRCAVRNRTLCSLSSLSADSRN